ncbi:MAG: LysM peptidoglycan-binding domain-containing protein [Kiritimatiellae bacterium]|nr:LysM peptidoglycan-binding domain-containing protein [Kiritimatiellia bacterium]
MSIEEGKYGLRHRRGLYDDAGVPFKIPLLIVATAAAVSFAFLRSGGGDDEATENPAMAVANPPSAAKTAQTSAPSPEALRRAEDWLKNSQFRTVADRTLLERLAAAERMENDELVLTTLENMRLRPGLADLEDAVAVRIGSIRKRQLLEPAKDGRWLENSLVVEREVRRTDTIQSLAREYGTTPAAIAMLNGFEDGRIGTPGSIVRILKFPRATLVVRKRTGTMDLFLNDRLFCRAYASTQQCVARGVVQVAEGERLEDIFGRLAIKATPDDIASMAAFMPPGAAIVLAN